MLGAGGINAQREELGRCARDASSVEGVELRAKDGEPHAGYRTIASPV